MSLSPAQLVDFTRALTAATERWAHLVSADPDRRVYEQIWDDDDVNAWVICWNEDADTGFHDHDVSAAAIAVVSGQVREDRLALNRPPLSRTFGPGQQFTVPPVAIHRVLHSGRGPAVTIHAYSPPLRQTGAYQIGPDGELERQSQPFEVELRADPVSA